MKYVYNIDNFYWNLKTREFSQDEEKTYCYNFCPAWPNDGKQFFIINFRTNFFRRFRLKKETVSEYEFISEDDIVCRIFKKNKEIDQIVNQ